METIHIDGADRLLPDDAREQRHLARRFTDEVLAPLAQQIDHDREIPRSLRQQMADAGFFGLSIPQEWGGADSILKTVVTVEELSRVSAAVGLTVGVQLLGSTPISLAATPEQAEAWLPDLAAGRKFCSFALTEPEAGTDASNVTTTLAETSDGYTLSGHKHYISGATVSDIYTVFSRSGSGRHEMTAALVPATTPGFRTGPNHPFIGMRGIPVGNLWFDDVQLPRSARLGEPGRGFHLAMATLDRARPAIAAQALGIAQGALDAAIDYTARRVQFGKPLLEQPVVQYRISRHAAAIAAARQLCYHAARLADLRLPELNSAASMAKLVATDLAMDVVVDAMQLWGGQGYLEGAPTERMFRDAKITQIYEGTNEIQSMVIARNILKALQSQVPAAPAARV